VRTLERITRLRERGRSNLKYTRKGAGKLLGGSEMGRQVSKHKRRLAEEDAETIREDYVKKMRDNYPLIIRTLMHDIIVSIEERQQHLSDYDPLHSYYSW
jgi:hypothetical protein